MQTASTGSGFTGVEAPSPAGRAPSIGALITEAYALPLAHPLQCGSCALVPFIMFSIALLLLSKLHGGALALLTLPIFAIAASTFVVEWQQYVLWSRERPFGSNWGMGASELACAGLLLLLFAPMIVAAWIERDGMGPLFIGSPVGTLALFCLMGLEFPAMAAGSRDLLRPLRANTLRHAVTFGAMAILAAVAAAFLAALVFAIARRGVSDAAFVALFCGTFLAFCVLVVAPPATALALAYQQLALEIRLPSAAAPPALAADSVLALTPDREVLKRSVIGLVFLIPWSVYVLWTVGGAWTLLIAVPIGLQLLYVLLYYGSVMLLKLQILIDHETIRWITVCDEFVIFLRDIAEVQVRRAFPNGAILCLVLTDLDRALAHDFYRRRKDPTGMAKALLALHERIVHASMEIDLGELMSALKGGRLPSGLGGKLELHLEGDAAFLKDTCRFNYERYGVHVLLLTSWPKARVLQCAREMERRRAAAVAAAAN